MLAQAFIFGLFGLIVGSFLNVLILRHGQKSVGGRSACMSCAAPIRWYDMIPVVSWLALRGRCRSCGSSISVQYPLVESSTAILFAVIGGSSLGLEYRILFCIMAALLVALTAYDLLHTILPDRWVLAFAVLALAAAGPLYLALPGASLPLYLLAGPSTAAPLFFLWFVSRGRWMGFGDVKLALGMGWLLGPVSGFNAVFLAFVLGAVICVPLLAVSSTAWRIRMHLTPRALARRRGRGLTMKSEVPFGPFLVASTLILWLAQIYHVALPILWL